MFFVRLLELHMSANHQFLGGHQHTAVSVSYDSRSTILQQQFNKMGKVNMDSVALPVVIRPGGGGPESFQMGSMPQAKQHITSGQMHRGHMPPLVKEQTHQSFTASVWRLLKGFSALSHGSTGYIQSATGTFKKDHFKRALEANR